MKHVAIVCKPQKDELVRLLPELIRWLRERGYEPVLDREGASYIEDGTVVPREQLPGFRPELVIVLGGDGTLLAVGRIFAATGTPILSVNLGTLGFLTEVRLNDLYRTLDSWCSDCHTLEPRAMLRAELCRGGGIHSTYDALNDIVVTKGEIARMGDFAVELDAKLVARFRADGVIVSTPTGSTAYSLAANGPILPPDVDAMVVTPICPHLLTLRPIVVRGDSTLSVRVEGIPNLALLTVDGQRAVELQVGDEIRCQKSPYAVNLLRLSEGGFFEALRTKLSWGER
ncbi:NAD(+)/NADH kinase [Acidobacteria bacterium AB60]|nr:NAD(+)/NADH kinase [Acidobacteria bacterium AB60]